MQIFLWTVVGLATAWGLLKFFLDVHAVVLARKEGWRLSRELAERATTNSPEPIECDVNDALPAAAENRAVLEEDRKAA